MFQHLLGYLYTLNTSQRNEKEALDWFKKGVETVSQDSHHLIGKDVLNKISFAACVTLITDNFESIENYKKFFVHFDEQKSLVYFCFFFELKIKFKCRDTWNLKTFHILQVKHIRFLPL